MHIVYKQVLAVNILSAAPVLPGSFRAAHAHVPSVP